METATGQMDRSGAKRDGGGVVRGSCRLMSSGRSLFDARCLTTAIVWGWRHEMGQCLGAVLVFGLEGETIDHW